MRKVPFETGEFYHIYNRGVDKRDVLLDRYDLNRFFMGMCEFNTLEPIGSLRDRLRQKEEFPKRDKQIKPLVNFLCYSLIPNHFHFILEQLVDNGIVKFMQRWGTSCTNYFNIRHYRSGVLFQGKFKSAHISSNERLLELSVYVNLNDRLHQRRSRTPANSLLKNSWNLYTGKNQDNDLVCRRNVILDQFDQPSQYRRFAEDCFDNLLERCLEDDELKLAMLEE